MVNLFLFLILLLKPRCSPHGCEFDIQNVSGTLRLMLACAVSLTHQKLIMHYSGIIMSEMAAQSPAFRSLTQPFVQAQIKETIKAPRHWSLRGEFSGDQ